MGKNEETLRSGHGIRHLVRAELDAADAAGGVHRGSVRRRVGDCSGHPLSPVGIWCTKQQPQVVEGTAVVVAL
jgi:hypothetical protein